MRNEKDNIICTTADSHYYVMCSMYFSGSGQGESCMQRQIFERREGEDADDRERVIDDTRVDFERNARSRGGQGARARDTSRTINGVLTRSPCDVSMGNGLRCEGNMCRMPDTPSTYVYITIDRSYSGPQHKWKVLYELVCLCVCFSLPPSVIMNKLTSQ